MRNTLLLVVLILFYQQSYTQLGKSCVTPNEEQSYCFPLRKCHHLQQSPLDSTDSSTKKQFLNESICGSINHKELLVCCGLLGDYKKIDYASLILDTLPLSAKITDLLPSRSVCGRQPISEKIFGGYRTEIDEYPWMALMEYRDNFGNIRGFQCGGVLISSRYVLTAAHCVIGTIEVVVGKLFRVRLGEYDLRTKIDCVINEGELDCADPPKDYLIEQITVHEQHLRNKSGVFNDIALVRLVEEVTFTDFIKPICLPLKKNNSSNGDVVYVAGWGRIENGSYSPVKLQVDLNIVDLTKCREIYSKLNISLSDKQICALGSKGKDTCNGDSGGPLMRTFPDAPNIWFVEGLVSFGPRKCATDIPGVYVSIANYIDWILGNMKM